jgi:polar amino acid transport system permease protein
MFDGVTPETLRLLIQGLWLTIVLTLTSSILAVSLGILIGSLRLFRSRWATWPAIMFVETFRNIPALVLIIFWAFAFPNAFPAETRRALFFDNLLINWLSDMTGLSIPWYVIAALLGLTLNSAAYIAELFRAGVGTVAREHVDAAQTMGASTPTILRTILIPGGLRAAYPAITSRLIHTLKNTALASFVSAPEFFNSILASINRSFMAIEFLTLAALIYLSLAFGMSAGLHWLERYLYSARRNPAP